MPIIQRATSAGQLASLVSTDGTSGGFVKDSDRASDAQAQAQSSTTTVVTPANLAAFAAVMLHPGYVSGRWYMPTVRGTIGAGSALGAASIVLYPFFLPKSVTINTLGARITTQAASGNIQLAIYNSVAATGLPGTLAANTANISTTSSGLVSSAVVQGSGSVTLAPGLYWGAVNADATAGSTVVLQAITAAAIVAGDIIGSATQSQVSSGASNGMLTHTVGSTFGTWSDLTGTTSGGNSAAFGLVQMKVA